MHSILFARSVEPVLISDAAVHETISDGNHKINPILVSDAYATEDIHLTLVDSDFLVKSYTFYFYNIRHSNSPSSSVLVTNASSNAYIMEVQQSSPVLISGATTKPTYMTGIDSFPVLVSNASTTYEIVQVFVYPEMETSNKSYVFYESNVYGEKEVKFAGIVTSYPYSKWTDTRTNVFSPVLVTSGSVFPVGNGVTTSKADQVSSASFTIPDLTPFTFTAANATESEFSFSEMPYFVFISGQSTAFDIDLPLDPEPFSFSSEQVAGADIELTTIDDSVNLPSLYVDDTAFEVTNVTGSWKKVEGMKTLIRIENAVSARAMVKAFSSCPPEPINVRFKVASTDSSSTGFFILGDTAEDQEGAWSPDEMNITAFVNDPGWYELEWYVQVGHSSSMDWIRLVGPTIMPD